MTPLFSSFIDRLPSHLSDYNPGWKPVPDELAQLVRSRAQTILDTPIPSLSATDYLAFSRTGNRIQYEQPYFARRTQLAGCTLAYCLDHNPVFLDRIVDLLWAIMEESSWCLPAHNAYIRDTDQFPLPDTRRPIIDLFAAETAASLAQVHALIKPDLDRISPLIAQRMETEVQIRLVNPYLHEHFWWMGNEGEQMNNWTAWCTQNVLLATFLLPTDQESRHQVAAKALESLDYFLAEYGEDGCCNEGSQYYRHAALCLFLSMEVLNTASNNLFAPLYAAEKIANMARYIQHMHAQGVYYFNYSDCSAIPGFCTAREYLFATAINDAELVAFVQEDRNKRDASEGDLPQEINLTYRLLELQAPPTQNLRNVQYRGKDHYYPSVGIFISRDETYALSVKAGGNNDSHNHNDSGSITVYKNGHPILIDVGVETYTKKTFSKDRYSIWTMRSVYHSVTNFPPYEQRAGAEFQSKVLSYSMGNTPSISLELQGTYDGRCPLRSYIRTVTHHKNQCISVEDMVAGPVHPVLTLMSREKPLVQGTTILLGDRAKLTLQAEELSIQTEAIAVTDARLLQVWPEVLYRILISYTTSLQFCIT